jgi:hypothetical protein
MDTWLKPNIHTNEVFPEKYNVYRKDRIDQEGGGFLLAIKKEFISDEVKMLLTRCCFRLMDWRFILRTLSGRFDLLWAFLLLMGVDA